MGFAFGRFGPVSLWVACIALLAGSITTLMCLWKKLAPAYVDQMHKTLEKERAAQTRAASVAAGGRGDGSGGAGPGLAAPLLAHGQCDEDDMALMKEAAVRGEVAVRG